MLYPRAIEEKIRRLHICYENSSNKKYDLKCIKEAYQNLEMPKWEYEYALDLLNQGGGLTKC